MRWNFSGMKQRTDSILHFCTMAKEVKNHCHQIWKFCDSAFLVCLVLTHFYIRDYDEMWLAFLFGQFILTVVLYI